MKDFVVEHFKGIVLVASFTLTVYVQHVINTNHIEELTQRCQLLEIKVKDQYEKIDAIKLDKAVFEATMMQFSTIQNDIREMREDIKELLKNRGR